MHTDVWGPAQVSSLGDSHHYVTFIDDATREVWVYFLRHKYNVFQTFKKWKCLVENGTRKKLKCLRSDNGGEYCSHEFEDYFSTNGIHRQKNYSKDSIGKWSGYTHEHDYNGAWKEHEVACWVALTHVGGGCQ